MPPTLHARPRPRLLTWTLCLAFATGPVRFAAAQQALETADPPPARQEENRHNEATELDAVTVTARPESRDEAGRNEVYAKDVVNFYAGREEIERYKGTSVADLFKGLNGVYSGDARNSGALDPNIRGIQGEGRIPLTVDGTEQATSVWMGPAGVANRNYLDPNLIGGIMVEKGPSMTPGVRSGIGGSVQVRTLEADDIVRPGRSFGAEVKLESATNSVGANERSFGNFGRDYRDIPGVYSNYDGTLTFGLGHGSETSPRKGANGTDFDLDDKAFRLALASKQEYFDLLAAYSYRKRGNYFSGKNGASSYRTDKWREQAEAQFDQDGGIGGLEHSYVANYFLPGQEVTNTSSELESTLLKGTLRLPDQQTLKLGYMHSDHTFGESVPWLVAWAVRDSSGMDGPQAQYPYSEVKQDSYHLDYAWQPEDSRWIDLKAGLWMTRNDSRRHQNGDYVFGIDGGPYQQGDTAWNDYVRCHVVGDTSLGGCASVPATPPEREPDSDGQFTIYPKALQISSHDRWGINLSNTFRLHPTLNLTVGGDFSHEKLRERDASEGRQLTELTWGVNHLGPRSGTREQQNYSLSFDWTPTGWLQLSAGARYSDYWSHDDKLAEMRAQQAANWQAPTPTTALRYGVQQLMSDSAAAAKDQANAHEYDVAAASLADEVGEELAALIMAEYYGDRDSYINTGKINGYRYEQTYVDIPYNGTHEGFAANDPFLNGTIDINEQVQNAQGTSGSVNKYIIGSRTTVQGSAPANPWQKPEKKKGHAWAPQFGITAFLTDNARLYARYAEFIRFPTIFEDTQAAWGYAGGSGVTGAASKPEHAYNWEIGYVHDLRGLFRRVQHADFRINYFDNQIRDYIDRDHNFNIVQFDRKTLTGVELQARFDTGGWFGNLGATYRLKQEMCDKDYAAYLDPVQGSIPECVTAGFPRSFARTSLQPEYSLNLDLGARLLQRRLELGGRLTYHAEAKNKDEEKWGQMGWGLNRPYYWDPVLVFDAYASYRLSDQLSLDLGINNITNRYYIDPMARVMQPAPGRTVKLALTVRL